MKPVCLLAGLIVTACLLSGCGGPSLDATDARTMMASVEEMAAEMKPLARRTLAEDILLIGHAQAEGMDSLKAEDLYPEEAEWVIFPGTAPASVRRDMELDGLRPSDIYVRMLAKGSAPFHGKSAKALHEAADDMRAERLVALRQEALELQAKAVAALPRVEAKLAELEAQMNEVKQNTQGVDPLQKWRADAEFRRKIGPCASTANALKTLLQRVDEYLQGLGAMEQQRAPVQMPDIHGFSRFDC